MVNSTTKKPRAKRTGSIVMKNGHKHVRVSLPDGTRPWYTLCRIKKTGECTCSKLTDAKLAEMAAHVAERERERVTLELEQAAQLRPKLTVRQFAEALTSGELYREHGQKVYGAKAKVLPDGRKTTSKDDSYRYRYACDLVVGGQKFGDYLMTEVTAAEAKSLMVKAPIGQGWRPANELHFFQAMHRLFAIAEFPCDLREDGTNPFGKRLRPYVPQDDLIFQWLYPDEVLALLRCQSVPLVRRVLYQQTIWHGQRKASMRALRVKHVDAEHAMLTSPNQKNGIPLKFDTTGDALDTLLAWISHKGLTSPEAPLFGRLGCRWSRLAEQLRADLLTAGVKRASLQGQIEGEEGIRFHDLRATMVVWALKDPTKGHGWATDRTGHLEPKMLHRYYRAARHWKETRFTPFPAVWSDNHDTRVCVIPELSPKVSLKHLRVV